MSILAMHIKRKSWLLIITVLILLSVQSCRRTSLTADSQTSRPSNQSVAESTDAKTAHTEHDRMMLISGGNFLVGAQDRKLYQTPVPVGKVQTFLIGQDRGPVADGAWG